jgi:hypothetical protein
LTSVNLNTPNYTHLIGELNDVRRNGPAADGRIPQLDALMAPIVAASSMPNKTTATLLTTQNGVWPNSGYSNVATQLAQGNYSGVASTIATALTCGPNCYGNSSTASIYTNPQLSAANLSQNKGYTNYHSMQAQLTMRPVRGLSFQATYTWSRNLVDQGIGDYNTGERRYYLATQHRSHTLTSYGSYEMPFGPNGFAFRNATGAVKKAIEGWQLSWVANVSSGIPASLTGRTSFWAISNPVVERWDLWDNKAGQVAYNWAENGLWQPASFYGDKYIKAADPYCLPVAQGGNLYSTLSSLCTDRVLVDQETGAVVVRNARPGEIGNLTPNSLTGPGRWTLDMAMSKSVEFMEGKRIELRIDASNIFNHATPSGSADAYNHAPRFDVINQPTFALNGNDPLGYILTKAGHRTFQAKIRLSF